MFFKTRFLLFIIGFLNGSMVYAQKIISEGTLVYNISVQTESKTPNNANMLDGATTTISIKDRQSTSETVSSLGSETIIYDSETGSGAILKNYSAQKLMISLTRDDWSKMNKKYEGITYEPTAETIVIAGYNCIKTIAKLKNGTSFTVYYSPDLKMENTEYDNPFKTLPGLAMQYEWESGTMKFKYTLSKVKFDPVPSSRFNIPKSGYRILSFGETQKAK